MIQRSISGVGAMVFTGAMVLTYVLLLTPAAWAQDAHNPADEGGDSLG